MSVVSCEISDFLNKYGLTVGKKKLRNLKSLSKNSLELFKFDIICAHCCKEMDIDKAVSSYESIRALGIIPKSSTYYMLLSLVAGLGEQGSNTVIIPRENDPPSNLQAAVSIYHDMVNNNITITESCYTAMIRCYSQHNDPYNALEIYNNMIKNNISPKLRSYTWILKSFVTLECSEITSNDKIKKICFDLFNDMRCKYNIESTEKEYLFMLSLTAHSLDNRFYDILYQFMDDILIPTQNSWNIIKQWFENINEGYILNESIVNENGIIECTGTKLLSIDLDNETRNLLLKQIETFALLKAYNRNHNLLNIDTINNSNNNIDIIKNEYLDDFKINIIAIEKEIKEDNTNNYNEDNNNTNEYKNDNDVTINERNNNENINITKMTNKHDNDNDYNAYDNTNIINDIDNDNISNEKEMKANMKKQLKWNKFLEFLNKNNNNYNIIVDGANVGYYKQNYEGASLHVDIKQIDWLLIDLIKLGYKPLLILHIRHVQAFKSKLLEQSIIDKWINEKMLYSTPSGWNDDWFWMYSCVYYQCHIITNDEMRDHHFQMLSPRWFSRWKERHVVHFSFGGWINEQSSNESYEYKNIESDNIVPDEFEDNKPNKKQKYSVNNRRIALFDIPKPFSYRSQHIKNNHIYQDEYYFPAINHNSWLCIYRLKP